MTNFTIDVGDNYESTLQFYVSADNNTYTYIGQVHDEYGEYTYTVDQYASYVKIISQRIS